MSNSRNQENQQKRAQIVRACRDMNARGINQGTSGNISLRDGDGLLITPTSLNYDRMLAEDIVWMGFDESIVGKRRPSSEWRFHLDILRRRADVNAVVHAHPTACTSLAIMEKPIPPLHYMVAVAGGHDIRCAEYATFGTEQLSVNALAALQDRDACLLAHHGMIALGNTLDRALWLAVEVETLARQYLACLPMGEPPLLDEAEIRRVRQRMDGYGHPD